MTKCHHMRALARLAACAMLALPAQYGFAQDGPTENLRDGCIEAYDPEVNYFPERMSVINAELFSLDYHNSYKLLTVHEPYRGGQPEYYVLVQCGAPIPVLEGEWADARVTEIPARSFFASPTNQFASFEALNRFDVVTGVRSATSFFAAIADGVDEGRIAVWRQGGAVDIELILERAPDVFLTGGTNSDHYWQARELGVFVLAFAQWIEPTMLGRAEWTKVIAALLNEDRAGEAFYDDVLSSYLDTAARVADIADADRPLVMTGGPEDGVLRADGGNSYMAQVIHDAGGRYVFDGAETTGSLRVDLEDALVAAADADVWLGARTSSGSTPLLSMDDVRALEERLATIRAVEIGQVWNPDLWVAPEGDALAVHELGSARPDLIIQDLLKILHPDLMDDHEFVFYQQVPAAR